MKKLLKWIGITLVIILIISALTKSGSKQETPIEDTNEIVSSAAETQHLTHNELLIMTKENNKTLLDKSFRMTLYLEQQPLITNTLSEAEFMSQPDANSNETILIRCQMTAEDVSKLDGQSAQKGIYKPYELTVNFKNYDDVAELYYDGAECSLVKG